MKPWVNPYEHHRLADSIMRFSQDLFGDLTTVSLGCVWDWDEIGKSGDPAFSEKADRQRYHIGVTQILTQDLILALNFETVTDEGYPDHCINFQIRCMKMVAQPGDRAPGAAPAGLLGSHRGSAALGAKGHCQANSAAIVQPGSRTARPDSGLPVGSLPGFHLR